MGLSKNDPPPSFMILGDINNLAASCPEGNDWCRCKPDHTCNNESTNCIYFELDHIREESLYCMPRASFQMFLNEGYFYGTSGYAPSAADCYKSQSCFICTHIAVGDCVYCDDTTCMPSSFCRGSTPKPNKECSPSQQQSSSMSMLSTGEVGDSTPTLSSSSSIATPSGSDDTRTAIRAPSADAANNDQIGLIVGIVVGSIVVIMIAIAVFLFCWFRSRSPPQLQNSRNSKRFNRCY